MDMIKFKPKAIEVSEADPFKEDILGRKPCAEILTSFIADLEVPFVLAIDAPWGSGKTTFLRMWKSYLMKEGFYCLYFNAWETDFNDCPLISLIGEIGAGMEAMKTDGAPQERALKIYEKTKQAGAALLRSALPAAIKAATAGILDVPAALESTIGDLAEEMVKKQIDQYQASKRTLEHFRTELKALVEELLKTGSGHKRPLVFMIDELDRCRPPYAIALLEKVKHLFSVEGLVFILGTDRTQLGESTKALYGNGFDVDGYLRRFIDLEFRLPMPESKRFVMAQFDRFGLTLELSRKQGSAQYEHAHLMEILPKLFDVFGFSLRTQEQLFTQLAIVVRTTPSNFYLYGFQLALLLCLRTKSQQLYFDYCKGAATPLDVMQFVRSFPMGNNFADSKEGSVIEAHLVVGIRDRGRRSETMENYLKQAAPSSDGKTDNVRAKQVSDHFEWVGDQCDDITGYLLPKLEMACRFVSPPTSPGEGG